MTTTQIVLLVIFSPLILSMIGGCFAIALIFVLVPWLGLFSFMGFNWASNLLFDIGHGLDGN